VGFFVSRPDGVDRPFAFELAERSIGHPPRDASADCVLDYTLFLDAVAAGDIDAETDRLWGGGGPYGGNADAVVGLQYLAAWRVSGEERALDRAPDRSSLQEKLDQTSAS